MSQDTPEPSTDFHIKPGDPIRVTYGQDHYIEWNSRHTVQDVDCERIRCRVLINVPVWVDADDIEYDDGEQ